MANFSVNYLEHIVQKTGLQDLFKADETLAEGDKYSVRAARNPEQEKDLQSLHGIDTEAMMRSVLINEAFASMTRALFKHIEDAAETQSPFSHNNLIVGARVGSILQDDERFQADPLNPAQAGNSGLYRIGKIGDTVIFVNPFVSWSQTHSLILDIEEPVSFNLEDDDDQTHRGVILKIKIPEKLQAFVWNCPQEMLDRL
jgi:hypothetical protein